MDKTHGLIRDLHGNLEPGSQYRIETPEGGSVSGTTAKPARAARTARTAQPAKAPAAKKPAEAKITPAPSSGKKPAPKATGTAKTSTPRGAGTQKNLAGKTVPATNKNIAAAEKAGIVSRAKGGRK